MKSIVSISVDEELIDEIELFLEDSNFRNKSHLVETAIKQYLNSKSEATKDDKQ